MEPLSAGHPNPTTHWVCWIMPSEWVISYSSIMTKQFLPCLIFKTKLTFLLYRMSINCSIFSKRPSSAFRYSKGDQTSTECFGYACHYPLNAAWCSTTAKGSIYCISAIEPKVFIYSKVIQISSNSWPLVSFTELLLPTETTVSVSAGYSLDCCKCKLWIASHMISTLVECCSCWFTNGMNTLSVYSLKVLATLARWKWTISYVWFEWGVQPLVKIQLY